MPYITTPASGSSVECVCEAACVFQVQGTLSRPLAGNEELFLAIRLIDDAAPRYFIQFAAKSVNETAWTAGAQIGSREFPPQSGQGFEIWALVVDTSVMGPPPVGDLPALSADYVPGLCAVSSDVHTLYVRCGDPPSETSSSDLPLVDRLEEALKCRRDWILYSPFRRAAGTPVGEEQIREELQLFYDVGMRGLVTYEMMNGIEEAPRIAREIGYEWVIAGIYWYTDGVAGGQTSSSLGSEKAAVDANIEWIDGVVIGNEGLLDSGAWNQPRYTLTDLEGELKAMKAKYPDKLVTTAEGTVTYEAYPHLVTDVSLTDFVFPNIHPWWGGFRAPGQAVDNVATTVNSVPFSERGERLLVLHESWWPSETEGQDEDAQSGYFEELLDTGIPFCWGEAVDQPWKGGEEGGFGASWGVWHFDESSTTYQPKEAVGLMTSAGGADYCPNGGT